MTDAYNERFGLSNWLRLLESGELPATFSSDVQASGKNIVKKQVCASRARYWFHVHFIVPLNLMCLGGL